MSSDSIEKMIAEANELVQSVYRDFGFRSPIRTRATSNRATINNVLSPEVERQIAHLNDVMQSIDDNLRQEEVSNVNQSIQVVEDLGATQQQNIPEGSDARQQSVQQCPAAQRQNTPVRPPRQQLHKEVVIDLCEDSPKNDDVVIVSHVVPGVINLDSPALPTRRRSTKAKGSSLEVNEIREHSRSPVRDKRMDCPICMEDYTKGGEPATTICGHLFCKSCILEAVRLTKKCPVCKKKLIQKNIIRLYNI